jgi:hypothetical protein
MKTLYTWEQIKESKILSPERELEIENLVNSRFDDVYDKNGVKFNNIKQYYLTQKGIKNYYVFPVNREHFDGFYFREVMQEILTDNEIEKVNKYCLRLNSDREESEQFKKSKKINESEYNDYFFYNDQYYNDFGEFKEEIKDNENNLPQYVWATKSRKILTPTTVNEIFENDIDNNGFEELDMDYFDGVKELQLALDKFVKINEDKVSYWPDYSTSIILT